MPLRPSSSMRGWQAIQAAFEEINGGDIDEADSLASRFQADMKLRQALNPELGLTNTPGSMGWVNGKKEFIARPGAISQEEQAAIEAGIMPPPSKKVPIGQGWAVDPEKVGKEKESGGINWAAIFQAFK